MINIDKMTLREVMEMTRNMSIKDGGLSILIEKIVSSVEALEQKKSFEDEIRIQLLKSLREQYTLSCEACDPIEFQMRHRDLLYKVTYVLLGDLDEHEIGLKNEVK